MKGYKVDVIGTSMLVKKVGHKGKGHGQIYLPKEWMDETCVILLKPDKFNKYPVKEGIRYSCECEDWSVKEATSRGTTAGLHIEEGWVGEEAIVIRNPTSMEWKKDGEEDDE